MLWIVIGQTFEVTGETGPGVPPAFYSHESPRQHFQTHLQPLPEPWKRLLSRGSWAQAGRTITPTREGWTRAKGCPAFLPSPRPGPAHGLGAGRVEVLLAPFQPPFTGEALSAP